MSLRVLFLSLIEGVLLLAVGVGAALALSSFVPSVTGYGPPLTENVNKLSREELMRYGELRRQELEARSSARVETVGSILGFVLQYNFAVIAAIYVLWLPWLRARGWANLLFFLTPAAACVLAFKYQAPVGEIAFLIFYAIAAVRIYVRQE